MKRNILLLLLFVLLVVACGEAVADTALIETAPIAATENETQPDSADEALDAQTLGDESETPPDSDSEMAMDSDQSAETNSMSSGGSMMMGGMMGDRDRELSFAGIEQNDELSAEAIDIIKQAAQLPELKNALTAFTDWNADADFDGEMWWLEFYTESDWIGWAGYDPATNRISESEVMQFFTEEEIDAVRPKFLAAALADPEMQALVPDPENWWQEINHNPYENYWYASFYQEVEAWMAIMYIDENDQIYVDSIIDPEAFEAEQLERVNRDTAIEIAYEADALWESLANVDDYKTLVTPQSSTQYAVSFVTDNQELFYALIDIKARAILETK